jgi:hypothetical protein
MKSCNKFIMVAALSCIIILIESCSSSSLVDVWNDPTYHGYPLKKILIISIRKDPVQRRIWEDAFVSELSKHGVNAISSYHLFPDVLPDTNQVVKTVQENDFDGILVTRLLQKETETHYVEGYITYEGKLRYNQFRNTYSTYYHDVQHPGYVDSQIVDRRAIEVWVIRNKERIIWGATSNTPERNSIEAVQNDIADLVIPELVRKAIIKSGN